MAYVNASGRSSASNLEHAANLLCVQVNSASYPQRDGSWVETHGLRGKGLVADWSSNKYQWDNG